MNTSFQLLLYIMKIKPHEDKQFSSFNFSDVMWKPPIVDALHSGYLKLFQELLGNKNMI